MKTVIIYGFQHKRNTYNVVQKFIEKLGIQKNDIVEYFLPKNMPHFCTGCNNCFFTGEENCPHQEYVTPIKEEIWRAELIILASPVYVFRVTGQMKVFLDHFGFQFMAHRPNKSMFSKTALAISIAAGGGMRSAIKDMTLSLKLWGISKIYTFGFALNAAKLEDISPKNMIKINQKIKNISNKILLKKNKIKPNIRTKVFFRFFRIIQRKNDYNQCDKEYWEKHGWLGNKRPWKKE